MHKTVLDTSILTSALLVVSGHAFASDDGASMFRYPDISDREVVFVYANDLWRVPIEGGTALPLASPAGVELMPRFSPDGSKVAFVGNYDGGRDLYTVDVAGGVPHRVTHHPATELLSDWTADDQLIFTVQGLEGVPRIERPYMVDAEGGMPEALTVPYGSNATIDRTGRWLAYTPSQRDRRTWKRYQGGLASDIWLIDMEERTSRQVTEFDGTDTLPMWHGRTLYYLSDSGEDSRLNIFSYDLDDETHEQETFFKDFDVKWPAIGPDDDEPARIVFQLGSGLYVFDAGTGETRRMEIDVPGAGAETRPHLVDAADFIESWDISPTGKRAVVEARGDIWTLPAKNGSPRNLTRTSGSAERLPAWSPDGRWIAYFSDETGEYELFVRPSDGSGSPRALTDSRGPFKTGIQWSPNSESLLFTDKTGTAWLIEIPAEDEPAIEPVLVGTNPRGAFPNVSFSHDDRYLTWSMPLEEGMTSRIHIHDRQTGETHVVTDGMFNDGSPAFDREGDWLYFTSTRRFAPSYSDLDTTWIYDDSEVLVAVGLREDVDYPWLETSDEESWSEEDEEEDEAEEDAEEAPKKAAQMDPISGVWECSVDIPGMGELPMTLTLTLEADDLLTGTLVSDLFSATVSGLWDQEKRFVELIAEIPNGPSVTIEGTVDGNDFTGTGTTDQQPPATITGTRIVDEEDPDDEKQGEEDGEEGDEDSEDETFTIDFEDMERRAIQLPVPPGNFRNLQVNDRNQLMYIRSGGGIRVFDISEDTANEQSAGGGGRFIMSANGKKILIPGGNGARIAKAGPGGGGDRVVTKGMMVTIDPREEWRQLVTDAWRIQRDYFYDENLHGVDWDAVLEAYLPLVDQAASREDVSYIIGELIGELNVGHAYYWGGDGEDQPSMNVGMLGVDWEIAEGDGDEPDHYRISRIIEGGPWDTDSRNPLNRRGARLHEGDRVIAVNGTPLDTTRDPWSAFIGLAGQSLVLEVIGDEPDAEPREVVVTPMRDEGDLRYRNWIEDRRNMVDEATDGRVGYIYVPNTGVDGQTDLVRQFYGQAHKDALIIDERWNGGGQIPTRFIELLNRPVTNYWAVRDSKDWMWPPDSHQGPKAMLINGHAGSGGDMFPWLFRHNELGPIIGTRTWGGLVGISGNPGLIDGGYTAVPTFGFYETDGTWGIEGHGVEPDIEVVDDPGLMLDGQDPQLEKAIEVMVQALEDGQGHVRPERPASPDRSGMGITEEDK